MTRLFPSKPILIAVGIACALFLSACGRRGPLEPAPGAPDAPRNRAAESNMSTLGGATSLRPSRETATTENTDPDLPPAPMTPEQRAIGALPGTQGQVISSATGGQNTPGRSRRSPAPTTPFILDPLL